MHQPKTRQASSQAETWKASAHSPFSPAAEDRVAGKLDICFGGPSRATQRISDGKVTVDKVEEVLTADPGVLLWSSHGALAFKDTISWDDWSVLLTGETCPTTQMAQRIFDRFAGGWRASGEARELVVTCVDGKPCLAVTPTFVREHGNFDHMEGMATTGPRASSAPAAATVGKRMRVRLMRALRPGSTRTWAGAKR
jgi:hypothetical protein